MTRLIDADALKLSHCKECALYPDKCMGDDCDWGAIIHINAMPTIDAEPHWIPCCERLPEDGTYIVYAPEYRGGSSRSKEHHNGVMFASFKSGKWSIEHGYYSRPNCVIAWMPLPKPYEGEGR